MQWCHASGGGGGGLPMLSQMVLVIVVVLVTPLQRWQGHHTSGVANSIVASLSL